LFSNYVLSIVEAKQVYEAMARKPGGRSKVVSMPT